MHTSTKDSSVPPRSAPMSRLEQPAFTFERLRKQPHTSKQQHKLMLLIVAIFASSTAVKKMFL
jgi:hypothetical protein